MSTALKVYDKITDPIAAINAMGEWIGKSRMAGVTNVEGGKVVALVCMSRGIDIFDFIRTYHIVEDKPTMKADAMLAEFRTRCGGDHELVEASPERAAIRLIPKGKQPVEFELTWQEAQEARWPWRDPKDHGKGLKSNWSTPSDRQDMLWARCISRAIRKIQPEICSGIYTPEEAADFDDQPRKATVNHQPVDVEQFTKQHQQQEQQPAGDVVDAEFETVGTESNSTTEQRTQIRELLAALNAGESQIAAILAKRNVQAIHQLGHEQAAELIGGLTNALAGQSRSPKEATSTDETGPVDSTTIDEIKGMLQDPDLVAKVKEHLVAHGKQKISDLSLADASLLKNCLEMGEMESFFGRSLEAAAAADPT